jgi:hypothetical protein
MNIPHLRVGIFYDFDAISYSKLLIINRVGVHHFIQKS